MKYWLHLCTVTAVILSSQVFAQSERIENLKQVYHEEIKSVTTPVNQKYEAALIALQKKYVSENKLEEALLVKQEIEALKAGTLERSVAASAPASSEDSANGEAPMASAKPDELEWRGDQKEQKEGGDTVYSLEGEVGATRMMTVPIYDIKERFPNGLRIRFKYKSDGFEGTGVEMRCEFPKLRGLFTFRNPTLRLDGKWNEYLWPFSDTKGEDMMNLQMLLENGEGTVSFKDFELLAN